MNQIHHRVWKQWGPKNILTFVVANATSSATADTGVSAIALHERCSGELKIKLYNQHPFNENGLAQFERTEESIKHKRVNISSWSNWKTTWPCTAKVGFFTCHLNGLMAVGVRVTVASFYYISVIFQYQACGMKAYTRKDILIWDFWQDFKLKHFNILIAYPSLILIEPEGHFSLVFFFFFCGGWVGREGVGVYSPSRLFHSFWAESIVRWGENGRSLRKTTWPPASRTWLVSHKTQASLEPTEVRWWAI